MSIVRFEFFFLAALYTSTMSASGSFAKDSAAEDRGGENTMVTFVATSKGGKNMVGPTWEVLPVDQNPLFSSSQSFPRRLTQSQLQIMYSFVPSKNTPMSYAVEPTESSQGLLAVMACKGVQEESKILTAFGIKVTGHPAVDILASDTMQGPGYVFLQTANFGSTFSRWGKAESLGQTLVISTHSYLTLLEFVATCWDTVEAKLQENRHLIESGTFVATISPGLLASGDCRLVVNSIVLEEFENFRLLLDVSSNSQSVEVFLRYEEDSLHSDKHMCQEGCKRFSIPLAALKAHAKNLSFLENVFAGVSCPRAVKAPLEKPTVEAPELNNVRADDMQEASRAKSPVGPECAKALNSTVSGDVMVSTFKMVEANLQRLEDGIPVDHQVEEKPPSNVDDAEEICLEMTDSPFPYCTPEREPEQQRDALLQTPIVKSLDRPGTDVGPVAEGTSKPSTSRSLISWNKMVEKLGQESSQDFATPSPAPIRSLEDNVERDSRDKRGKESSDYTPPLRSYKRSPSRHWKDTRSNDKYKYTKYSKRDYRK